MSERNCALQSKAYSALRTLYQNQNDALQALKRSGKKLCWMFGDDVPEEVILAAGMFPVRLTGEYGSQLQAEKYLEISFGALWKACFEKILCASAAGMMDYLVLSNSSDLIQKLYYYLLQLKRIEPDRTLPEMYYVDYSLLVKDFSAQERNIRETGELIEKISQWRGSPITSEELRSASALCNRHRAALRKISALRKSGKILGSEALIIIIGSFFAVKEEAIALLEQLAEEAACWPAESLHGIVYTGSMQELPELYTLLEECGLNVIADDKLFGDRYCDKDVDLSLRPETGIAMRYHLRFPSSERAYVAERKECIPHLIQESGAKGFLVFMNHNDESYIWDFPKQQTVLQEMGIQTLMVEDQYYPLRDTAQLEEKFRRFTAELEVAQDG